MLPLIPVAYRETIIAQATGDDVRMRQVRAGAAEQIVDLPPPLTDERAVALKDSARDVFREIQAINRLAVLPAVFHAYLTRAEHSHDRLEDFIAWLQDELAKAKSAANEASS